MVSVRTIARDYDAFAERDAHKSHWLDPFTEGLLSQVVGNRHILEIGCGNGRAIPIFQRFGRLNYTGIDCSSKSIEVAKRLYPAHNFVVGDGFKVAEIFPDTRFDAVWLGAVLMIYSPQDARTLMAEVRKVVTDEAVGFLSVPYGTGTYRPQSFGCKRQYHLYNEDLIRYVLGEAFSITMERRGEGMYLAGFKAT